MEHRWGDRVRSNVIVKLMADPASVGRGRLRDVSITGAFVETKLRLRPLSTLHLTRELDSPNQCELPTIGAIVVRCDADGVGIEWFDGDLDAVTAIVQEAKSALLTASPLQQSRRALPRSC